MLTDKDCKNAKPGIKPNGTKTDSQYRMPDEKGLFLLIHPNGSKYWRMKYRHGGKEKLLALGIYPETTLSEARNKHNEARKQLREGIDPSAKKKKAN